MKRLLTFCLLGACAPGLAACGSARKSAPIARAPASAAVSAAAERGLVAFMKNCNQCHPRGEAGLAPAINDKPLPDFLVRFQVRQGLGAMPAFSEEEIGSPELDDILAYLAALKENEEA